MTMYVLGYSGFTRDSRLGPGVRNPFAKTDQSLQSILAFRDGEVPFSMFPLGFFGHDGSAALVKDGEVIACAAEERFTRVKYSLNLAGNTLFPRQAIAYCLETGGISIEEVDVVAHYCDFTDFVVNRRHELLMPRLTDEESRSVAVCFSEVYEQMMSNQVVVDQFARIIGSRPRAFAPIRHHLAHAASAFYPSGFPEALVFTLDGTGELESSMLAVGDSSGIHELEATFLPISLGTVYLILTVFLGFKSLGDEYKVMGLASYGSPARYRSVFERLVVVDDRGGYDTPLLGWGGLKDFLIANLGLPRDRHDPIESRHADIAAALQDALNRAVLVCLKRARASTGLKTLCMAGGVALNCTMNGVLARSRLFDRIFIQPAASDEGTSVGSALQAWAERKVNRREVTCPWNHACWGPAFNDVQIVDTLESYREKVIWRREVGIASTVAHRLAGGSVVGWFQGRMEFGPRALGNRSILADPRDANMKDRINGKVKRRESFRPFAPAVLLEEADEYFDMCGLAESPFMLFTVPVRPEKRAVIPAVTHVDGSARVQTVAKAANPRFWQLIHDFKVLTGVPVVLNTSFNVQNEPIVCSPQDAMDCFLSTDIDCMAIGDFLVEKKGRQ